MIDISVTFRHMDPNENLKKYVEEKVSRVKKYLDRGAEANVVLSTEKNRCIAEVKITGDNVMFNGKEVSSENLFSAIDLVMDKIMSQASRHKTKLINRKGTSEMTIRHNVITFEGGAKSREPKVVQTENYSVKPMTMDEAILQMDLAKNDFLVFTNAESQRVNVLYRRQDGNLGLIESEASIE